MGFIDSPPPASPLRPLPGAGSLRTLSPFGIEPTRSDLPFRSCRSSRLQRFPPQRSPCEDLGDLQVCCTLQPAVGFAMFPSCAHLAMTTRLPRWRRPFEAFPSPVAFPSSPRSFRRGIAFTVGSCLLVVGLWLSFEPLARLALGQQCRATGPKTSTSRLCSTGESVASSRRCRLVTPDAPMGFGCESLPSGSPRPIAFAIHVKERVSLTEVVETLPSR